MRIWTITDLHFKGDALRALEPVVSPLPFADLCVIAGDTADGGIERSLTWMAETIGEHMPIVTVLGNHDFYGGSIEGVRKRAAETARALGIHLLDDSSTVIGGVRFVGGTLWTDYALYEGVPGGRSVQEHMVIAKHTLPDAYEIDVQDGDPVSFGPAQARAQHLVTRAFIEAELAKPFDGATVVVTHHAPHPGSVAKRFAGDAATPAFVSDLSSVIETFQPEQWIHGHTHVALDYSVGRTRISCNPRGERFERDQFNPQKVITVERHSPRHHMEV